MSKRLSYKTDRNKVTNDIEDVLYQLINQELDYFDKKKHAAKWYRDETAELLKIPESKNPSLRSYQDRIDLYRRSLKNKTPLDFPWTIGACVKYNIPAEFIPELLEIKSVPKTTLTIREALWFVKLYPVLMPVIEKLFPKLDKGAILGRANIVTDQYARAAQIAEALDKPINTEVFDNIYFIQQDFSAKSLYEGTLLTELVADKYKV